MATDRITIDRARSSARIEKDVMTLAGSDFTRSQTAIERYAYLPEYRNTLDYFTRELEAIGFEVWEDPVGNLIGRNCPRGEPAFAVGSHCDSNRNGGKWDGTLGVVTALEVCRLSHKHELGLPLQLISFMEEESSAFAQALLGSRIMAQSVTEEELRSYTALDDGRSFFDHATEAGYEPERWRECAAALDGLVGWIELHIEQARSLQDTGKSLGIVNAIVSVFWADIVFKGRADHAGATPMGFRQDASIPAAETVLELERLANAAPTATVGTSGTSAFAPGIINVIPGEVTIGIDVRSVEEASYQGVLEEIGSFAQAAAEKRGMTAEFSERQRATGAQLDAAVVSALEAAARASAVPYAVMPSGAGHDTQSLASVVPSAMVFVPCKDGISHAPEEEADPDDAALAAEVMANAIRSLLDDASQRAEESAA